MISLPSSPSKVIPFPEMLPETLRELYSSDVLLVKDQKLWRKAKKFKLRANMSSKEYALLLVRLTELSMVSFLPRQKVLVTNGFQAVWKDHGAQRLIFDGRPTNLVLEAPQTILLLHPTDLGELVLELGEELIMAKLDLDSYYHRLALPKWMWPILGFPSLKLSAISACMRKKLITLSGVSASSSTIYPVATTLPMRLSHSVFIAQFIHLHLLQSLLPPHSLPLRNLRILRNSTQICFVYIDDFCIVQRVIQGKMAEKVNEMTLAINKLIRSYDEVGLPVNSRKTVFSSSTITFLGIFMDGKTGVLFPPVDRLGELFLAMDWIFSSPVFSLKQFECLLGHWVWQLLLQRPPFSVAYAVYKYLCAAKKSGKLPALWVTVKFELMAFMVLAPFLFVDLRKSDAALTVAGVVRSVLPNPSPDSVQMVDWSLIFAFAWKFAEHIDILEGLACLYAIRGLLSSMQGVHRRISICVDNLPLQQALTKGRSSSFSLSRILRSVVAAILASSASLSVIWIPSYSNPADY